MTDIEAMERGQADVTRLVSLAGEPRVLRMWQMALDDAKTLIAEVRRLRAELKRYAECDCGQPRAIGVCTGHCDNDE